MVPPFAGTDRRQISGLLDALRDRGWVITEPASFDGELVFGGKIPNGGGFYIKCAEANAIERLEALIAKES
jgi:hypothetical protein